MHLLLKSILQAAWTTHSPTCVDGPLEAMLLHCSYCRGTEIRTNKDFLPFKWRLGLVFPHNFLWKSSLSTYVLCDLTNQFCMDEHLEKINIENNKKLNPKQARGIWPVRVDSGCNTTTDLVHNLCISPYNCISHILDLWMHFFILTKNSFLTLFFKLQIVRHNPILFSLHEHEHM